jgi:hypothetical protein
VNDNLMKTMQELVNTADHAANQSDRWMFVVTLIIFLCAALAMWRWMLSDREKVSKRLTEMTDRHIAVTERLADVVANNTAVLHQVEKKL